MIREWSRRQAGNASEDKQGIRQKTSRELSRRQPGNGVEDEQGMEHKMSRD